MNLDGLPEANDIPGATRGHCWHSSQPPCRGHAMYPPAGTTGRFIVRCDSDWDPHVAIAAWMPAGTTEAAA